MKKILAIAACVMLSGSLLVSGTLAADLNRMAKDIFEDLTHLLQDRGAVQEDGDQVNVKIVSGENVPQLYPGGTAERTSCVENRGTESVYFRLAYAMQYDADSWDELNITFDYDAAAYSVYPQTDWQDIEISGTPYKMKVFTYQKELAPIAKALPVKIQIEMDTSVTNGQLSRYRSDFLQMKALAIGSKDFVVNEKQLSAEEALHHALPLESLNPF